MKNRLIFLLITAMFSGVYAVAGETDSILHIHYIGHCAFILRFNNNISVVTDYANSYPYYSAAYNSPIYNIYDSVPDVATYSHRHTDHYAPGRLPKGVNRILENLDSMEIEGLRIHPVRTSEANTSTPDNSSFIFQYKGFTVVHTGDLTANMKALEDPGQKSHLRELFPDSVDVLLCIIDGVSSFIPEAEAFIDFLHPKIVIPMHYWTPATKISFLNYLQNENVKNGKNYQIVETGNADFAISENDATPNFIRVVSLNPYPYGQVAPNPDNMAIGAQAFGSATIDINHTADRAVDGFSDTRWQAPFGTSKSWFMLKLPEMVEANGLIIKWLGIIKSFCVMASVDSVHFDTIFSIQNREKGVIDSIIFEKRELRFIRLNIDKPGSDRTGINEIELYQNTGLVSDNYEAASYEMPRNLKVFPNPADEFLTLNYDTRKAGLVQASLISISGLINRKIVNEWQAAGNHIFCCNLSGIPDGMYLLNIVSNEGTINKLIIKMH
jgi:L-ascorbate metabolism protein UlaG (beta-lactamase superfamily)